MSDARFDALHREGRRYFYDLLSEAGRARAQRGEGYARLDVEHTMFRRIADAVWSTSNQRERIPAAEQVRAEFLM